MIPADLQDPSPDAEASRRALATDQQALEPKDILPAINTTSATTKRTKLFEPGELENMLIERSGLLKAKPPIRAGVTGNDFYQVIPFQVCSLLLHCLSPSMQRPIQLFNLSLLLLLTMSLSGSPCCCAVPHSSPQT